MGIALHSLRAVPAESIGYHGERNNFSNWFTARTEFALALQPAYDSVTAPVAA